MNIILLQPTDVLFFRDGRPMTGSYAGHTAAWPLPDLTNHALHAALHRAGLAGVHMHRHVVLGNQRQRSRDRRFGSLVSAGPFPVRFDASEKPTWFFPRPKDATIAKSVTVTLRPSTNNASSSENRWTFSSLPKPLCYAVVSTQPPTKETGVEPWINAAAWAEYLGNKTENQAADFVQDKDIADQEAYIGIAIDPETQTTGSGEATGKIYSAYYLRLRDHWRLGLFAEAMDKVNGNTHQRRDLIAELFSGGPQRILVGGQQRLCTAIAISNTGKSLPLPLGLHQGTEFQQLPNGKYAVKWVLLSPAIWPEIPEGIAANGTKRNYHPGGWLPNWISPETGAVLLRIVPPDERRRRRSLDYSTQGYDGNINSVGIGARLVAALIPKPLIVTGWAIPSEDPLDEGGAKSTHLAVPAGAVYYFEAENADEASRLAAALNWHGETQGSQIKNRRSTLLGEKGYGLGVCGTWQLQCATSRDVRPVERGSIST